MSDLDLSPLEITEVEYDGIRLRLKQPLVLQPHVQEGNPRLLIAEDARLGLDVFAGNQSGGRVAESLVVGWKSYALASDTEPAPQARQLKFACSPR